MKKIISKEARPYLDVLGEIETSKLDSLDKEFFSTQFVCVTKFEEDGKFSYGMTTFGPGETIDDHPNHYRFRRPEN